MPVLKNKEKRAALRRDFYNRVEQEGVTIREAVRTIRIMLGKSQTEYAKMVGVPTRTIKDFEQGRGNPTYQTLQKLLKGSGLELGVIRKQ